MPRFIGIRHFAKLVQIDKKTGLPTGVVLDNIPSNPGYIPDGVDENICHSYNTMWIGEEATATCEIIIYSNVQKQGTAQKNNCVGPNETGSIETYTVLAGAYTSNISQADADAQAQADVDANKQSHANSVGTCIAPTPVYWSINFQPKVTGGSQENLTGITGTFSMKRQNPTLQNLQTQNIVVDNASPAVYVNIYSFVPIVSSYFVEVNILTNTLTTKNLTLILTDQTTTNVLATKVVQSGETGVFTFLQSPEYSGIVVNIEGSLTDKQLFTSTRTGDYQKNNCLGVGEVGTIVTYSKDYTSTISQADANSQAASDTNFPTEGQNYANTNGTCKPPLPSDATGIVLVDIYNSSDLEVCGFVDTLGVTPYQIPVFTGSNFLPDDGTPAANCWALASDIRNDGSLSWRFGFNVARLINTYPEIPQFVFKIRGRGASARTISGAYSLKGADSGNLKMVGSPGTYIPTTENSITIGLTNYSGKSIVGGADGNIGIAYGSDILVFTYDVASKTLTLQ